MNINRLCSYFGGVLEFVRDVQTENGVYKKGTYVRVTPAILYLVATNVIDSEKDFKLHLRTLSQLENSEIVELCKMCVPESKNKLLDFPKVSRNGFAEQFTIEVHIDNETSFLINSIFDLAVCEKMDFGGQLVTTFRSVVNQAKAVEWALGKHLDIFYLIPKGKAFGRQNWNLEDYERDPLK